MKRGRWMLRQIAFNQNRKNLVDLGKIAISVEDSIHLDGKRDSFRQNDGRHFVRALTFARVWAFF